MVTRVTFTANNTKPQKRAAFLFPVGLHRVSRRHRPPPPADVFYFVRGYGQQVRLF